MLNSNQETTLPVCGDCRVLVHGVGQLASRGNQLLRARRSINICPEEGLLGHFEQLLEVKDQRACLFIIHAVKIHDVQDELAAHDRHAHWD